MLAPVCLGNVTKSSMTDWLHVLPLAHKWGFNRVEEIVIGRVNESMMDPILRYSIGKSIGNQYWLDSAIVTLLARKEYLSPEDTKILGADLSHKVAEARDAIYRSFSNGVVAQRFKDVAKTHFKTKPNLIDLNVVYRKVVNDSKAVAAANVTMFPPTATIAIAVYRG